MIFNWRRFTIILLLLLVIGTLPSAVPQAQEASGPAIPIKEFDSCGSTTGIYEISNRLLFFIFCSDGQQIYTTLWRSDGTTTGTQPILTVPSAYQIYQADTKLFFWTGGWESQLWSSDGTPDGTIPLQSFSYIHPSITIGDMLYFVATREDASSRIAELWSSDGTVEGTRLLKPLIAEINNQSDIHSPILPPPPPFVEGMERLNNTLLILVRNAGDYTLWRSDGTPETTTVVMRHKQGFYPLQRFNNRWLLIENNTGRLWQTDGTPAGTLPTDMLLPSSSIIVPPIGTYFFVNDNISEKAALIRSNATAQCTFRLAHLPASPWPRGFSSGENFLLFAVPITTTTTELWKSDGTAVGTQPIAQLPLPSFESEARFELLTIPIEHDIHLIMHQRAKYLETTLSLWQSDGTAAGTKRIQEGIPLGYPETQTAITEDAVYFWAAGISVPGRALWKLPRSALLSSAQLQPSPTPEIPSPTPELERPPYRVMLPLIDDMC